MILRVEILKLDLSSLIILCDESIIKLYFLKNIENDISD